MCGKGHTLLKRLLGRVGRYKLKSKDGKVLKKLYNGVLLKEYYSPATAAIDDTTPEPATCTVSTPERATTPDQEPTTVSTPERETTPDQEQATTPEPVTTPDQQDKQIDLTSERDLVNPTPYWIKKLLLTDEERRIIASGTHRLAYQCSTEAPVQPVPQHKWFPVELLFTRQSFQKDHISSNTSTPHPLLSLGDNDINCFFTLVSGKAV